MVRGYFLRFESSDVLPAFRLLAGCSDTTEVVAHQDLAGVHAPNRWRRSALRSRVWVLVLLALIACLPFINRPAGPDESGFLLVASQWRPGHSLYGNYWVDRPPLLLLIFDLASHLGGVVGLRLIGLIGVVVTVLLATLLT